MSKKTRNTLSFLARIIIRLINNDCIPVPDMDRLKRISDNTPFKDEHKEQIIDFDKNIYVKVKGRVFDCYLSRLNQDGINTWETHEPMYTTELRLIAVDPQPIMM